MNGLRSFFLTTILLRQYHSGYIGLLSLWNRDSVCVEQTQGLDMDMDMGLDMDLDMDLDMNMDMDLELDLDMDLDLDLSLCGTHPMSLYGFCTAT